MLHRRPLVRRLNKPVLSDDESIVVSSPWDLDGQANRQAAMNPMRRVLVGFAGVVLLGSLAWIVVRHKAPASRSVVTAVSPAPTVAPVAFIPPSPLRLILTPQPDRDATEVDRQIAHSQSQLSKSGWRPASRLAALDALGWLFVAKARAAYDEGSYKLAEQCSLEMEAEQPGNAEALLLRGHVLHQFHRFKEAEILARKLVAVRGTSASGYGLLGDSLMEQGLLDEAGAAYQTMLNLKPGFESYVRAAHYRWLKRELAGARSLMSKALGMVDARDAATLAWTEQRVALYDLQAGDLPSAQTHAEARGVLV